MSSWAIYRCVLLVAALFFGLSAYAQVNDPDPELWIIIYLIPAFLSLLIAFNPEVRAYNSLKHFIELILLSYTAFGCYTLRNYDVEANPLHWLLHDEEGRELSGLMISILWLWLLHHSKGNSSASALFLASLVVVLPLSLWVYIYFNDSLRKLWPRHCQTTIYPSVG